MLKYVSFMGWPYGHLFFLRKKRGYTFSVPSTIVMHPMNPQRNYGFSDAARKRP